ncbi:MAG: hypothetical protein LUE08_02175 [Akkermansiaceae bacterium]|nr:hypothetical protein [Akkermansiaceae bacterium]
MEEELNAALYQEAAEQGNAEAQYRLGECYAEGEGVEKDVKEAVRWWRKAADQGHAEARMALHELGSD